MIQYSNTHRKEVLIPEIEMLTVKDGIDPGVLKSVQEATIKLIQARPEDFICVHITIGNNPTIKASQIGIQVTGK